LRCGFSSLAAGHADRTSEDMLSLYATSFFPRSITGFNAPAKRPIDAGLSLSSILLATLIAHRRCSTTLGIASVL
jgi:hypothetical protein